LISDGLFAAAGRVAKDGMAGVRYLTSAGRFLLDAAGALEGSPRSSPVKRVIALVSLPRLGEHALDELDLLLHQLAEQTAVLASRRVPEP